MNARFGDVRRHCLMATVSLLALGQMPGSADGIYRNGIGARSMALGGADAAWAVDPLGAMGANPAGLGFLTSPAVDIGVGGASASGHFTKGSTSDGHLDSDPGVFPEGAVAIPLGKLPVTLGLAFIPEGVLSADWHFADPGFPTNPSYTEHKSEISVLRTAAGLGISLGKHWSVGGSMGFIYNENTLDSPYIFQSQPKVKGAETVLDLNTRGWGYNGEFGLLFRPVESVQLGVTYTSETTVFSHGHASGDVGAQFGVPSIPFNYDAQVKNVFPQTVTGGVSWKFCPQWRLAVQVDWINWGGAFVEASGLPVSLSNGNNATVNGVIGSTSLNDYIPLQWEDEFVYRGGLEYAVTTNLTLRAGYCYGGSPVPSATLTPMTAVLMENTVTAGVGYHWSRYKI